MTLSSTRALARSLDAAARGIASLLGRRKALRVLGHLRYLLASPVQVTVGEVAMRLAVLDRRGTYWALDGIASEPETKAWVDRFAAGDIFYDIGANVGLYSLYAALARDCRCVALEPNPFSFDALIRNVLLNGLSEKVVPLCLAVGDEGGLFALGIESDQSGAVGSTLSQAGDTRASLPVMVARLDELVEIRNLPFPNHVKIDVDGIEDLVLAGGRAVLSDRRVKSLLVEACDRTPDEAAALRARVEACGLSLAEAECSATNWVFRRG